MGIEEYAKALVAQQRELQERAYQNAEVQEVLFYLRMCLRSERDGIDLIAPDPFDEGVFEGLSRAMEMVDLFLAAAPEP